MQVKSFTQVTSDDEALADEINEFIQDGNKKVIDIKYITVEHSPVLNYTNPHWIVAFVHYEDSTPMGDKK
jgi:hypothetical protein